MPAEPCMQAVRLCQYSHTVGTLCRVARSAALAAHAAAPEAARAPPLLLRTLDVAIALCDLWGLYYHLRVELAGARGLLMLIEWADRRGALICRRVRPHESGLWARQYAEIEEVDTALATLRRRGLRWDEALNELRLPLRALYAFYGSLGLSGRGFPPWAIADVRRIRLDDSASSALHGA